MAAINHWQVTQAANHLLDGRIIAYPTEAVWGLGCDPENEAATTRLLAIKERPVSKGLIVVAGSSEQLESLLRGLNPGQRRKVLATWPGPTTWLIPDPDNIFPSWIKGEHASVAVRVSAHPLVRALCLRFGGPLVSTSANKSGHAPARSALQVVKHLGADIDGLLHGRLGKEMQPSRIIELVSGRVFR
jgi:L-threonylcarbamoyladenylate synthase